MLLRFLPICVAALSAVATKQQRLHPLNLVANDAETQLQLLRLRHSQKKLTASEEHSSSTAAKAVEPTFAPRPESEDKATLEIWKRYSRMVWVGLRLCLGWGLLVWGILMWVWFMPSLIMQEHEKFQGEKLEGRSFNQYLTYRFNYWMNNNGIAAMGRILWTGLLTLLTVGAFMFAILTGKSPVTGLWMCLVWASAASVDPNLPAAYGFVGMFGTMGGLILLAVLLTTIADWFAKQVEVSKQGSDPVVEGNHCLILGHSSNSKTLIEELAVCGADDKPTTVVLMSHQPKSEIEDDLQNLNTDFGDLKLVVRSGKINDSKDLWKCGADCAARIVIPDNPGVSCDESDAATFGVLLTLKGQGGDGWPTNGYVAVQCCLGRNVNFMKELYDNGKTYVFSGERLGRVMVQSVKDQGLCQVFSQLIGFDGDEFYTSSADKLGVAGMLFGELPFWFPATIPLGVVTADGKYLVNPEKDYEVSYDDQVILLAADDDDVCPVEEKAFFDFPSWLDERQPAKFMEANPNDSEVVKVLICNFNDRGAAMSILFALDEMSAPASEVHIYASIPEEEVKEMLVSAQKRQEAEFKNISVTKIFVAAGSAMTSLYRLKELDDLESYDHVFVLADNSNGIVRADEQTVAMILQMQSMIRQSAPEQLQDFQPLVEVFTSTAESQLALCGIQNLINTSALVSKALAMVSISPTNHGVLGDLLSADGNNLDIMDPQDYLAEDEELPSLLTFAEAAAIVGRGAQQVLIGWSSGGEWVVNPKEKLEARQWTAEDRFVVIKDI
mmetsp:Transcript_47814/g.86164  ORF Transcript_47814/g.86164 Transcript_47814/m.86164 type:complete len:782 (-) Transcript_47814:86-2431(-)